MSTALSAGDLTALRTRSSNHASKTYLSIVEPTSIATARINQASFTNPVHQITIDNASVGFATAVKAGMSVWVGTTAGARDVAVFRVRKTSTTTTLYIGETGKGDYGLLSLGTLVPLADNQYITIVDDYNLHTVYSRIAFSGGAGVLYKDYDVAYADQTTLAETPVIVNIGEHVAGFVNTGTSLLTVSKAAVLDDLGSGVTIASYSWDIGDGSYTVGGSTSSSWTATFPVGQRWVRLTATLSNGATVTARRVVIAHNTTTDAPLSVVVQSDRRNREGRRSVLELPNTALDNTDIPDGTMMILWESATWAGGDISTAIKQFVGFAERIELSAAPMNRTTIVEMVSALLAAKNTGFVSQQLTISSDPQNWAEVETTLAHTEYYLHYLMYWHSQLLLLFDFDRLGDYDSYLFNAFSSSGGNLPAALNENAARLNAFVGQGSNGTIYCRRDPQYMTDAERTALAERMTVTETDLANVPSVSNIPRPLTSQVRGYGFAFNSTTSAITPYAAYAPAVSRGQGVGVDSFEGQLVASQSELNTRVSNRYAHVNNPYPRVTLEFTGNYDVFDIPDVAWLRLTVGASYWVDGSAINARFIPLECAVRYGEGGDKVITLTVERETDGIDAPAETVPIAVGDNDPLPPLPDYNPEGEIVIDIPPFDPQDPIFGDTYDDVFDMDEAPPGDIVIIASAGRFLARLFPELQAWELIFDAQHSSVDYDIVGLVVDPNSPRLTTDRENGEIEFWLSSERGIHRCEDALATVPTVTFVGAEQPHYGLRPTRYAIGKFGGIETDALATTGTVSLDTKNVDTASATPVAVSMSSTSTSYNHMIKVTGTYTAGGYTYDGAYRTNDSWATYSRYNTFQIDGEFVTPNSQAYNSSHEYLFQAFNDGTDTFNALFVPPSGAGSGTGTMVVNSRYFTDGLYSVTLFDPSPPYTDVDSWNYPPLQGYDCADFFAWHLYVYGNVMKAWNETTEYLITGMASEGTKSVVSVIRVPYRQITSGRALNNSTTALHVVYGVNMPIAGSTLWRAILNTTTQAITSETDITPVIGGASYICKDVDALEINFDDPRVMMGWFEREDGVGGTKLLLTTDSGASWSLAGLTGGNWVRWVTPQAVLACGSDDTSTDNLGGLRYSPDRGATWYDYNFDWDTVIGVYPIRTADSAKI